MAFQTISSSVSLGLRTYLHERTKQADFIKLANDAFDVLNSRNPTHFNPLKCSFRIHLRYQVTTLDKFYKQVDRMKVLSRRKIKHYPFQKGILMTINSIQQLYNTLKEELGIEYINVNRLKQDVAENAFGINRGLGGFKQNPNCVDAKYRLLMLCIG